MTGFCYTLCYAAVVTKTNRISRIFEAKVCNHDSSLDHHEVPNDHLEHDDLITVILD